MGNRRFCVSKKKVFAMPTCQPNQTSKITHFNLLIVAAGLFILGFKVKLDGQK
jgi:hypothetical protein